MQKGYRYGNKYRVRPTSINATTMVEHSGGGGGDGGGFAVRAHVNIQGGFFPLCAATPSIRAHREENAMRQH